MQNIGSKSIRVVQAFILLTLVIWILVSVACWIIKDNINLLYVAIFGAFTWGLILKFYLTIYEISLEQDKITIRNLFSVQILKKEQIIKIRSTFFSPMIYRVEFFNGMSFLFAIDNKVIFRSLLKGEDVKENLQNNFNGDDLN